MKHLIFILAIAIVMPTQAASVIDMGTLARPLQNPAGGSSWLLSSEGIDINNAGIVAVKSIATGPIYRCGFRNSQTCQVIIETAARFADGNLLSASNKPGRDAPIGITETGDLFGSVYAGQTYTYGGGRIWKTDGSITITDGIVTSANSGGQYINELQNGIFFQSFTHNADGSIINIAGIPSILGVYQGSVPRLIIDDGSIAGVQRLQKNPDISGAGWFYSQIDIDALPRTADGLIDDDSGTLYPYINKEWTQYQPNRSISIDANSNGLVIVGSTVAIAGSNICGHTAAPCDYAYTSTGNRRFSGINDNGDAVGMFYPIGSASGNPSVWLRDSAGLSQFDLNVLINGSGYTVLDAKDINASRQIAATCLTPSAQKHACLINL